MQTWVTLKKKVFMLKPVSSVYCTSKMKFSTNFFLGTGNLEVLLDYSFFQNVPNFSPMSFQVNLESFKSFKDHLFIKQITARELLFGSTVHTIGSSFPI